MSSLTVAIPVGDSAKADPRPAGGESRVVLYSMTPEQLAARWGIGASVVGALLQVNPYVTREQAIAELSGEAEPFEGNDDTDMGHAMEPLIARWYARATGLEPVKGETVRHPDYPWAFATPDYIAPDRVVELKNKRFRSNPRGPHCQRECFKAQAMWQMACRGLDRADVFIHYMSKSTDSADRFERIELVRDPALESVMMQLVEEIWFQTIVPARRAKGLPVGDMP